MQDLVHWMYVSFMPETFAMTPPGLCNSYSAEWAANLLYALVWENQGSSWSIVLHCSVVKGLQHQFGKLADLPSPVELDKTG